MQQCPPLEYQGETIFPEMPAQGWEPGEELHYQPTYPSIEQDVEGAPPFVYGTLGLMEFSSYAGGSPGRRREGYKGKKLEIFP